MRGSRPRCRCTRCRTAVARPGAHREGCKVAGSCRVSCSCGPGRAGTLIGRRKAPKALRPSAREDRTTRGLVQARSSLEPSAHQQSHPAHVVVRAGIVWRTSAHKGSPFLRRRAPAPNTADHEGSPGGSRSLASHRGTLRRGGRNADQQNAQEAVRGEATFRSRGRGRPGGTRTRTRRRCALGVPQGVRNTGRAADGGHGSRGTGSVRSLCGRCGAGARHHAWTCRIRPAACLCSRGSDCTTRMGRSCRCAGASVRRTVGKAVRGEP